MKHLLKLVIVPLFLSLQGCAILFGNVQLSEKSENYKLDSKPKMENWEDLKKKTNSSSSDQDSISDVAYQSKKTGSILSLNSSCRKNLSGEESDLKSFSNTLTMGIDDIENSHQESTVIQGKPALETFMTGKLSSERMSLKTIVLRSNQCVYDFMYIARPDHYQDEEGEFNQFVRTFEFK